MSYNVLVFGKHKGRTLPYVIFNDPDWFFYMYHNEGLFGRYANEADELYIKATHIRIPGRDDNNPLEAEYVVDDDSGGLEDFSIVHEEEYQDNFGVKTYRKNAINIGYAIEISTRDGVSRQLLKKRLKSYLFGDAKIRLTTNMCEAFFDNAENFVSST